MGWADGERNLIFYADNGRIVGQDHEWVQDALSVTVAMFHRMGLETNLEKIKSMVCTTGFIWVEWGEQAYKQRASVEGAKFQDRKKFWVSCTKCGVTVAQYYLKQYMVILYGICFP